MAVPRAALLGPSLLGMAVLSLAGCSEPSVSRLETVPADTLMSISVVIDPPADARSLGTVAVTRCRDDLAENPPAEVSILNGMKAEAARQGGNAIRVIGYRMGLTVKEGCYHTMTGRAEMYRLRG